MPVDAFFSSAAMVVVAVVALIAVALLGSMVMIVSQQDRRIVEMLGRFHSVKGPGLCFKPPWPIATVAGEISLRIQEMKQELVVKTKDNVFITLPVTIMYQIIEERVSDAFYQLQDPEAQVETYVLTSVRSEVSSLDLQQVFGDKTALAEGVKHHLDENMRSFGYKITQVLVDQPEPPDEIKAAFNRVIAAQRQKEAAELEGDANRIRIVKAAEAEAESKRLQGQGIANQRKAIAEGLRDAVKTIGEAAGMEDRREIMQTILLTQYFDALTTIGASSKTNTLIVPHSPGALRDIATQIREGILAADLTESGAETSARPAALSSVPAAGRGAR